MNLSPSKSEGRGKPPKEVEKIPHKGFRAPPLQTGHKGQNLTLGIGVTWESAEKFGPDHF